MLCPQGTDISLQEHPEFLALLQDEEYVEELKVHPAETLAKYHIELDPKDIPTEVALPKIHAVGELTGDNWMGLI